MSHSSHVKITKSGAQKFGNARIMTVHIYYSTPAVCRQHDTGTIVISFFPAGPQLCFVNRILFSTSFYPGTCPYLIDQINSLQLQLIAPKHLLCQSCRPPAHFLTFLVSRLTTALSTQSKLNFAPLNGHQCRKVFQQLTFVIN